MYSPFLGDATSVLLVIPGRELTDLVAEAVQGSPVPYRVFWVSQLDLAAVRARDVSPQIILIDAGPGADEVLPLIAELGRSVPQAKLLLLATPDAMAVVQPAILAGAAGFVTLPLDAADLLASLRRVTVRRGVAEVGALAAPSAGHVIALCAPKGGTGRTTLAINTAICLRQITREPVVLVDADFAAPAIDVALNLRGERTIVDLLPRIGQLDRDLVESILAVHPTGLKLLLAPPPANLKAPVSAPHMQQIVAVLRRAYRSVLVDVGLPIDETALALLDMADRVILSVIPEMVGVRNARTMIDQFRRHGLDEDRVWLVLNQADLPGGIMARDAEERLGVHAHQFLPRDQALATATVNQGVPFVLLRPHSPFARGCLDLAQKLVKSWPAAPEPGLSPAAALSAVATAIPASESAAPPSAGAEAAVSQPAREGPIDPEQAL
ncbi:MAG TPA: AAA family ATPase, partial [Anaerolineae bacterium]